MKRYLCSTMPTSILIGLALTFAKEYDGDVFFGRKGMSWEWVPVGFDYTQSRTRRT
jgi:hypothetical protein